tara:strand:- start:257 stop:709 length:453 start_codon:yes stop_codon:yes gene_type:complete
MKNIILTSIALLSFTFSYAQVDQVKEVTSWETIGKLTNPYKYVELSKAEFDDGFTMYMLTYQNLEYEQITDLANIQFEATEDELDYVYNELLKGTAMKKNDEAVSLDIGKGTLFISRAAAGQVRLMYKEDGVPFKRTWLSKGQLRKLFGK